ncbi:hypothetical protein Nepgr_018554 [Nepenthes gracilis]|uniref:SAM domain-containing protein n=1 Tax=Nepenthes gracilis TaxID=150966 RepID=A0AAD3SRK6_NEPGR|nr:hypothetical protein Nepgr_018554 [Nepenthes gracilis]
MSSPEEAIEDRASGNGVKDLSFKQLAWQSWKREEGEGRRSCVVDDDDNVSLRDSGFEVSESLLQEQNPLHRLGNLGVDGLRADGNEWKLQVRRTHSLRAKDHHYDGVELDEPSDAERNSGDGHTGKGWRREEDGVSTWLNGLGLGSYWRVFKIHETDEEVLPLLTLEDLKEMGINAVGSRRKMYCAVEQLSSGPSRLHFGLC